MLIELSEREYNYILRCFNDLLPSYCEQIRDTLYIDKAITEINNYMSPIYSFELSLSQEDIDIILKMKKKLKKHKTLEEFELYDQYVEFFFFIDDFIDDCKKRSLPPLDKTIQ